MLILSVTMCKIKQYIVFKQQQQRCRRVKIEKEKVYAEALDHLLMPVLI